MRDLDDGFVRPLDPDPRGSVAKDRDAPRNLSESCRSGSVGSVREQGKLKGGEVGEHQSPKSYFRPEFDRFLRCFGLSSASGS